MMAKGVFAETARLMTGVSGSSLSIRICANSKPVAVGAKRRICWDARRATWWRSSR